MADNVSWSALRAELGVDREHPAYKSARIALELGVDAPTGDAWRDVEGNRTRRRAGTTPAAMPRIEGGGTIPALPELRGSSRRHSRCPSIAVTAGHHKNR